MDDFIPSPTQPGEDFKPTGSLAPKESTYQRVVPEILKNAVGGVETAGRMLWNVPAGAVAGGLGGIAGFIGSGGDMNKAEEAMGKASHAVTIEPFTKQGEVADEMVGKGYDFVKRDVYADTLIQMQKQSLKDLRGVEMTPEQEAALRSKLEGEFDATMFLGLIKQGLSYPNAIKEAHRLSELKEKKDIAIKQEQQVQQAYGQGKLNQTELAFSPEGSLIPPGVRSPYNLTKEQIAKAEAELNPPTERRVAGQSELFTEYQPADANLLGPAQRGARERLETPETARADVDPALGFRQGELETRQGHPYEQMGKQAELRPLEYNTDPAGKLTDFGSVGEARKLRLEEQAKARLQEAPIEPSPELAKWNSVPKSQRGGLYFTEEVMNGTSAKAPYREAFEWLKSKWPRFSEVKDIVVLSKEQWERATKNNNLDPKDNYAYMSMKDGYIFMPEGFTKKSELVQIMAHELRHGFDLDRRHPTGAFGAKKDPKYWMPTDKLNPWASIPAEKKAMQAERHAFNEFTSGSEKPLALPEEAPSALRGPGRKQAGMIDFGAETKKKGLVPALMDFKTQFNVERRPLKDVINQEQIKPESLTDIAATDTGLRQGLERLWKEGISNAAIDKTMSILAATRGDVGKIVKWVVDQRRQVTRDKDINVREREEAILRPWKELGKNRAELQEMKEIWLENIGKEELTRESFKTEKQWQTFKAIQDNLKAGWEETNVNRKIAGLKPITFLKNYYPSIRQGEYWIRVVDQLGKEKSSFAAKTLWEAKRIEKGLRESVGEGLKVEKPFQRGKGPYELADLSAFEETLKVLEKNDPITQQIQARYAELAGKRGFARTGIFRKGIPGALGFEKGEVGLRNAEKVLEQYVKRQEAYNANLKIAQLRKQFAEIPKELREKIPMAEKWINEYLNHAVGMSMDKLSAIRNLTETVASAIGLERDVAPKFMNHLSGVASLAWLSNMRFFLSQGVQFSLAIPKIIQMRNIDPSVRNSMVSVFEGQQRWFTKSADSKAPVEWASKHGYLDSAIAALLGLKATDIRGQQWGVVGAAARYPFAKLERNLVRGPVFLMFDSALKDSIKEPQKRWEVAAEMMDYYMTHYDRESSPLMYNKLGLLGEAARPLKQYSHNNYGQFFEYLQTAKNLKDVEPLAAYMGFQALVGGMKGIILVAEATAIVAMINYFFPSLEVPTPEEWLLRHGMPNELVYGIPSNVLGADISSSLAAPSMPSMFSSAPYEFGKEALEASFGYLTKKFSGTETDADTLRAAMALSPKAMHGWLEELYTAPGGPVPKPKQDMKGTYRRGEEWRGINLPEKMQAKLFGLKSVDEARADAVARITKELIARDIEQKITALDAIADRIMNNKPITDDLLQKYVEEGGDAKNLTQSVKDRIINRTLTHEETMYKGKEITPNRVHKLERMRELLNEREEALLKPEPKEEKGGFKKMSWGADKANDFTEPKDGAMRPFLNIRSPKQEHLDDGAEYARKKRAEGQAEMLQRWETTNIMKLVARAKKLYPNNLEKQRMYLLDHDILEQFQKSGTSEFIDRIQEKDPRIKKEIML